MESQVGEINVLVDQMRILCALLRRQQEQNDALRQQARRIRARSQQVREWVNGRRFELVESHDD